MTPPPVSIVGLIVLSALATGSGRNAGPNFVGLPLHDQWHLPRHILHHGFRFASDDQAARREAGRLGVRLTGTIGILAKAVRLRICDIKTADRYLAKMIGHGFYAPVRS